MDGAREADVVIGDKTLHVAAVHGTGNLRKFIERMRAENIHYDFIEVMACVVAVSVVVVNHVLNYRWPIKLVKLVLHPCIRAIASGD